MCHGACDGVTWNGLLNLLCAMQNDIGMCERFTNLKLTFEWDLPMIYSTDFKQY